jgi:hypothetical protein
MPHTAKIFAFVVLLLLLASSWQLPSHAQGDYRPIGDGFIKPINLAWSPNSQQIVFQNLEDTEPDDRGAPLPWHSYNVVSQNITQADVWPLQPTIQQTQLLNVYYGREYNNPFGEMPFVFVSPNGLLAVYPVAPPDSECPPSYNYCFGYLALANLKTGESITFADMPILSLLNFQSTYKITWSADSSSFTFESNSSTGLRDYLSYVTGITPDLDSVEALPIFFVLNESLNITVAGERFLPSDALAISPNGQQLVLNGFGKTVLWDTLNSENNRLLEVRDERFDNTTPAAMFSPYEQGVIWFIGDLGLTRYEIATERKTVVNPEINNGWIQWAWFSPDGRYVAAAKVDESKLYAIDISQYVVPVATPTPTPTFTPTPSRTPTITPTNPSTFTRLHLVDMCSPNPAQTRRWAIVNVNPFQLAFTWQLDGTTQQGAGYVAARSYPLPALTHSIETQTIAGSNTVRLFVNGVLQAVKTSTGAQCPSDFPPTPE